MCPHTVQLCLSCMLSSAQAGLGLLTAVLLLEQSLGDAALQDGHASVQVGTKSFAVLRSGLFLPKAEGKWLFGSLTSSLDQLPVGQMLAHQLHQSVQRPFDHRILYVSEPSDTNQTSTGQRKAHSAMLEQIKKTHLVDEISYLKELQALELAKRSMEKTTAEAFVDLHFASEYNTAMAAFLARCLDGGFDHCAWLDSDIFVHRGSVPWVDEAIQRSIEDPRIMITEPSFIPFGSDKPLGFSSRYFVYHTKALQHALPFSGVPTDTFEAFVNNYLAAWEGSIFQSGGQGGSWVIHPPDEPADLSRILEACMPGGQRLEALLAIVEQGNEGGGAAYLWRDKENDENMDKESWLSRMRQHCSGHKTNNSFLELATKSPVLRPQSTRSEHTSRTIRREAIKLTE